MTTFERKMLDPEFKKAFDLAYEEFLKEEALLDLDTERLAEFAKNPLGLKLDWLDDLEE